MYMYLYIICFHLGTRKAEVLNSLIMNMSFVFVSKYLYIYQQILFSKNNIYLLLYTLILRGKNGV